MGNPDEILTIVMLACEIGGEHKPCLPDRLWGRYLGRGDNNGRCYSGYCVAGQLWVGDMKQHRGFRCRMTCAELRLPFYFDSHLLSRVKCL